ncbi:MAG: dephospho-CoA kinase [Chloroflexi bacterium]|nr:dephospho-CoA kinase [Chloroflexota bacterium]
MSNFYLIGLVGNLGSGKSTVRKMLEQLGARGIDADALVHVVMQRASPTWRAIVGTYGLGVLQFNGRIDRRKLATKVFNDPVALQKLEAITHPAVGKLTREMLRDNQKPVVVLEAIKLVEAGMGAWCDELWVVNTVPSVAVERVMESRNINEAEARARLAVQGSLDNKIRLAKVVIDNSGDLDTTRAQVERAWRAIRPGTARDKSEWLYGLPRVEQKSAAVAEPVVEPVAAPPTVETPPIAQPVEPVAQVAEPPAPPVVETAPLTPVPAKSIDVRRSRRSDLEVLSIALSKKENRATPLTREETLKRFGERGYRIALSDKQIVALLAWEAENLIASVREIWAESADDATLALPRLLQLVESEASELLCEVVFLMLDPGTPEYTLAQLRTAGYEQQDKSSLHKLWSQAVEERLQPGELLWGKQLREQVITKPF